MARSGCANTELELRAAHDNHGFEPLHVAVLEEDALCERFIVGNVTNRDEQNEVGGSGDVVALRDLRMGAHRRFERIHDVVLLALERHQ